MKAYRREAVAPIRNDVAAQTLIGAAAKTVIVADETAFVRDRFRAALAGAGHRVLLASSRAELLACVGSAGADVDLVVLDVRLSSSNATSLIRQLQRLLPHKPPIIALSGTVGHASAVRELTTLDVTSYINEYTNGQNIVRALHPFLGGNAAYRRSSPRVPLSAAISFRHGHTIATAVTLNIGRGGLAIRSTNPLPCGTEVRIRLRLPGAGEVEAEARVVWSDANVGMGLQFARVTAEHQAAIDQFVDTHFFADRKA